MKLLPPHYLFFIVAAMSTFNKANAQSTTQPVITLPQGSYTGSISSDGVAVFHGIPYSRPFERFEPPQPIETGQESRNASSFEYLCPQLPSRLEIVMGPLPPGSGQQNELECGVVSLYRSGWGQSGPEGGLLPVIVWLHGGAFVTGGSEISWYEGISMAREQEVLVVAVQYRLGAFGYLYDQDRQGEEPGTLDAVLALEWVQQHARELGGDPDNVTLMGQSAGAYTTSLISDIRPDLFRRAVMSSSPAAVALTEDQARRVRASLEGALPASRTVDTASVSELLAAQGNASRQNPDLFLSFSPIRRNGTPPGGSTATADNSESSNAKKQFLIGWMKEDAAVFIDMQLRTYNVPSFLRSIIIPVLTPTVTRRVFIQPNRDLADRLRAQGHQVTLYEHTWRSSGFALGATHCVDLPLLWGDEGAWREAPMIGGESWTEWNRRGVEWRRAVGGFAREGTVPSSTDGTSVGI